MRVTSHKGVLKGFWGGFCGLEVYGVRVSVKEACISLFRGV